MMSDIEKDGNILKLETIVNLHKGGKISLKELTEYSKGLGPQARDLIDSILKNMDNDNQRGKGKTIHDQTP